MISTHRNLVAQLATEMLNSEAEDAKIIDVLETVYKELPADVAHYDALRDNTIALADVYNIIYRIQSDYKNEIANCNDDPIRLAVLEELFLGDDTLAMLRQRRNEIANSILKNEFEHINWYNTLKPHELNDVMLYHRASLISHSWELLDNGKSCTIAREDILNALCTSFNNLVDMHEKARNKNDREMKRMVISAIYQVLDGLKMTNVEMRKIEPALRRFMKQNK